MQKCWGCAWPCGKHQAKQSSWTHLTSPCTPSPQGWGGQQGLSLPRASFQGTRGAEEGLLQCGGPSHRWAQAPVLPRVMGAEPDFRPSEKGPVMMAPPRSHCLDNPVAP